MVIRKIRGQKGTPFHVERREYVSMEQFCIRAGRGSVHLLRGGHIAPPQHRKARIRVDKNQSDVSQAKLLCFMFG